MNVLNPLGAMSLLAGIVLLYSAVKNKYPQDVIREALGKQAIHGQLYVKTSGTPTQGTTQNIDLLPPATGIPITVN